jgi:hypothetical protein
MAGGADDIPYDEFGCGILREFSRVRVLPLPFCVPLFPRFPALPSQIPIPGTPAGALNLRRAIVSSSLVVAFLIPADPSRATTFKTAQSSLAHSPQSGCWRKRRSARRASRSGSNTQPPRPYESAPRRTRWLAAFPSDRTIPAPLWL